MSNPRLPPLRPTETKQDVPRGSSDPRRGPSSSLNLGLEQENGSSIDTCRAIHALWNQDMKEAAVRMYRVESSLRASQEEVTRRNTQQEEDMLNLRAKVYVLEEKVHMLRNECQTQRHEHRSLSQDLGAELHCTRELIHQMTGDIQSLKENQSPAGIEVPNGSEGSDSASSPVTPEAMDAWRTKASDGFSGK